LPLQSSRSRAHARPFDCAQERPFDIARGRRRGSSPRRAKLAIVLLAIAAFGPYLLAEGLTGFQNSRAMLAHVRQTASDQPLAIDAGRETLLIATDPTQVFTGAGFSTVVVLAIGGALAASALLALWRRGRRTVSSHTGEQDATGVLMWLTVIAIVVIVGQAVFFALMRRPLGGYHYVTLPAPFYAVVPAAFLRELLARPLERRAAPIVLAVRVWPSSSGAARRAPIGRWRPRCGRIATSSPRSTSCAAVERQTPSRATGSPRSSIPAMTAFSST
jgi:hypothetical protein